MEQIYTLGIECIEFTQYFFADNEWYFEVVNKIASPNNIMDIMFPVISVIDSVFGVQLLLCMALGGWVNSIFKWWLQEDRPYWWVRETTYYSEMDRPVLKQTIQTCETGPGSPSGHSAAAATSILLVLMWIKHIMHDRKCYLWWWKHVMYPVSTFSIVSVMLARMYTASHFPHQCLLGALVGSFLAPFLCIYISDPYIWRYGVHSRSDPRRALNWHVTAAVATIIISVLAYYSLQLSGQDPQWTIKLAFRWCEYPEFIQVSSTPIFALVISTASLLGLALCVTPAVAEYRHYTKNRSLIISAMATVGVLLGSQYILENVCKNNTLKYYATQFGVAMLKPMFLLRVVPAISMWPFEKPKNKGA